jgi:hypothetical protein
MPANTVVVSLFSWVRHFLRHILENNALSSSINADWSLRFNPSPFVLSDNATPCSSSIVGGGGGRGKVCWKC